MEVLAAAWRDELVQCVVQIDGACASRDAYVGTRIQTGNEGLKLRMHVYLLTLDMHAIRLHAIALGRILKRNS